VTAPLPADAFRRRSDEIAGTLPNRPRQCDMSDAAEMIAVTFSMTADDYARYFAVMGRQGRPALIAYVVALFAGIPVALALRALAAHLTLEPAAADLVGQLSLAAFLIGAFTMLAAGLCVRRIAVRKYLAGTLNAFNFKTAVFDATGITLTGQISQATWRWAAATRFTSQSGLFLIWVGQSAPLVIPARSFGGEDACEAAAAFIRARLPAPQSVGK
jgi:hypothetical protein